MPRPASWTLFPARNEQARVRLFCFPYAGGGASLFNAWPRGLPPHVEVVAVQPPGREGRLGETPYSDLARLVAAMVPELRPHMDRPFAFFGHSNGGLMAFEVARALRREGGPMPRHLFVGGRPAPQVERDENIHDLPHDEFIDALRRYAGTPEEVLQHAEIMELVMPLLRADFALGETYVYRQEPPLDVPITAYGGEFDAEVPAEEIEAWREQTSAAFRCQMYPGDHFFINGHRGELLRDLSAGLHAIDRALEGRMAYGF
jgi:medium-chain acyl-[acyl-carrier-protein] hydrolase